MPRWLRKVRSLLQSRQLNIRLFRAVTGVNPGQLDAEMEKTQQHINELKQRLEELEKLKEMRESISRNKNFLKLSDAFAEDK